MQAALTFRADWGAKVYAAAAKRHRHRTTAWPDRSGGVARGPVEQADHAIGMMPDRQG